MGNITKNLLLALALVSVIALVVFCIQLIVLNRGGDPAGSGATISSGSRGSENSANGDNEGDDEGNENDINNPPPRPPLQGIRRELLVSDTSRLVIYASDELFEFEQVDSIGFFEYTGEGTAFLDIRFVAISQQGIAATAESFLNNYSGSTTSEYSGEETIHSSELSGYRVSTRVGSEMYEAWLLTLNDSDVSLVLVINYQNDQQRDELYRVLSSLDMI